MSDTLVQEKIQDKEALIQVLGCLLKEPSLVIDSNTNLSRDDFPEMFHKILFGVVDNLYKDGATVIDEMTVDGFLNGYPDMQKIFDTNRGYEYMENAKKIAELGNFHYHLDRFKKMSLLRHYFKIGLDISPYFRIDIVSNAEVEKQQAKLDSTPIQEIMAYFSTLITDIEKRFDNQNVVKNFKASDGMRALKERLKLAPDYGLPLMGKIMNTISRGARVKKLHLRSSASGFGKSRLAVGDAMLIGAKEYYDDISRSWIENKLAEPVLYITTELEDEEIQTMIMANISNVNEYKIKDGKYELDEEERVDRAIEIVEESNIRVAYIPDFDIEMVEREIKENIIKYGIKYVFFDYIHMSAKLINAVAKGSGGMKLREDQIQLLFVTKLKQLCNDLGVFLSTSTQLNDGYKTNDTLDESILRGAKSTADKVDFAVIALPPREGELEGLPPALLEGIGVRKPNMVYHVYKVRGGRYSKVKVWSIADLGTCRSEDLFVTKNDNTVLSIEIVELENILDLDETVIDTSNYNLDEEDLDKASLF